MVSTEIAERIISHRGCRVYYNRWDFRSACSCMVGTVYLSKRDRVIAEVKARTKKKTHTFVIRVPFNVEDVYAINRMNQNTH
mmetsp:Transcript_22870/g.21989  ORF Transcript_22870/g.21989 Transcript_22870/m.21989 type:complete len:82 (+) Transcript_22870:180-425(+)